MLVLKDGTKVPGVTTITGQLDKPFLVKWANNLGKKGIDCDEIRTNKAKIGTMIHNIIESHLLKQELDISIYNDEELEIGDEAYSRYFDWELNHLVECVEVEKELVSEAYKFGGILDVYCKLDGLWTIIDIKTSKSIGDEMKLQVSAYDQLARENNLPVDMILIINVGKEHNSQLEVCQVANDKIAGYFKFFTKLLDLYYCKKEIGWNE